MERQTRSSISNANQCERCVLKSHVIYEKRVVRFCASNGDFAPHAMLCQMSRTERMGRAYLHMDHHLRGLAQKIKAVYGPVRC
jgi:Protein of unknown function (DUF1569)